MQLVELLENFTKQGVWKGLPALDTHYQGCIWRTHATKIENKNY